MKNNLYTYFLIGVGLAIATTSSYGRQFQSTPKKHVFIAAKQGKKHTINTNKHGKVQTEIQLFKNSNSKSVNKRKLIKATPLFNKKGRHQPHKPHKPQRMAHSFIVKEDYLQEAETREQTTYIESPPHVRIHSLITSTRNNSVINQTGDSDKTESPHRYITTHGIIRTSLSSAGEEAGLSEDLIIALTNIFAWDIDFATNLHYGDQFTVVYENNDAINGEQIIAAEFVTQGRILTAVKYNDDFGNSNYYTPEGKAMRKAFLSTPVDFIRISSRFDTNRLHPILNKIRAHKGVDYAARIGTPVKSTGDGIIAFMGNKGAYGQLIVVKHGEHYETAYAHLSSFKKDLQEGDSIQQGEIIGYVGQSGLATGPHLHYEFRVDGIHRNPEAQDSRQSLTLMDEQLVAFKNQAQPILSELYHAKARNQLARNQERIN